MLNSLFYLEMEETKETKETKEIFLILVRQICFFIIKISPWDSTLTYSPRGFVCEGTKVSSKIEKKLDDTLLKHSLCNLHETCDVSTLNVVNRAISLCTKLNASLVDRLHDEVELVINLLTCP